MNKITHMLIFNGRNCAFVLIACLFLSLFAALPVHAEPGNPWNSCTLTAHFVDKAGNTLAPDFVKEYSRGDVYQIEAPEIDGYTHDTESLTGTIYGDLEITHTYLSLTDDFYTVTIICVDGITGETLKTQEERAEAGSFFSFDPPEVDGYVTFNEPVFCEDPNGISSDLSVTKNYWKADESGEKVVLLIHHMDQNTAELISEDTLAYAQPGEEYTCTADEISGYDPMDATQTLTPDGPITEVWLMYFEKNVPADGR